MNKRVSRLVSTAVVMALGSVTVQAGTPESETVKKDVSKEVKTGMVTGAIIGAILGGPFGASVGFILGTTTGAGVEKARTAKKYKTDLEQQLAGTQQQLTNAQALLAASSAKTEDPMLTQLAQRLRADVLFRTASAELDSGSAAKLADLGAMLAGFPRLAIEIDGYADPRGKAGENLELSQQRASAVRAALMVGGAPSESIKIVAHGEQLSTAAKGDLDAYALERRVSFSVLPAEAIKSTETQVAKAE